MPDESKPVIQNYKPNSHASKATPAEPDKKIEAIPGIVAKERKKTLGQKFAEMFTGESAGNVWNYVLLDVLVPSAKNMASDALTSAVERFLFGDSRPRGRGVLGGGVGPGYTNYNRMSTSSRDAHPRSDPRQMTQRARAAHDFAEIVLETRGQAEEVLDRLTTIIEDYQVVTVNDLYDAVNISGNFTDAKWGWDNLAGTQIRHVREGWLLDLPRPIPLN